jgi:hypothetical protein
MSIHAERAGQLLRQGRKKMLYSCAVFGVPVLLLLTTAGFQYAGILHLEEYFTPDHPENVDPRLILTALGLAALLLGLFWGAGMIQAFVWLRQGTKLRHQPGAEEHLREPGQS